MASVILGGVPAYTAVDDWQFSSDSPAAIISAATLSEVLPLLKSVETAVAGGAFAVVMLSYEAAPIFDHALTVHQLEDFPLAWAAIFSGPETPRRDTTNGVYHVNPWLPLVTPTQYEVSIEQIREFIARGDTYQVNYAFPLACEFDGDPLAWYRDLCRAQPAPYSAYLDLGKHKLLCLSPELFFRRQGDRITTKPMKGTAPRGRWVKEDDERERSLRQSEKDRAENVMIVDLLRNDLGKISIPGGVEVTRLFELERYDTLWQMTSTVEANLRAGVGLAEALGALFPCGSITGAPKIRTMQIIRELEPFPRGAFTGTIGLVRPGGDCCFNVAIRTVVLNSSTGRATFGVGGGITFSSTPKGEYEECLVKAAFLTRKVPEFNLLESLLLEHGEFFLLERHLNRLRESSQYFGFKFDEAQVLTLLRKASEVHHTGCWKVRLLQNKDGACEIEMTTLTPGPAGTRGVSGLVPRRIKLAPAPVDVNDRFLFHKTTYRALYDEALKSAPDCDDVILWNEGGEVTESIIANVVVSLDGRLCTPPVESGLLAGTFRAELLDQGVIQERRILTRELQAASSFYLINSVRKWMPAVLVD
jgi:para-aminobenzoate synthetase/4-amino-4-deoxychorismate lyase